MHPLTAIAVMCAAALLLPIGQLGALGPWWYGSLTLCTFGAGVLYIYGRKPLSSWAWLGVAAATLGGVCLIGPAALACVAILLVASRRCDALGKLWLGFAAAVMLTIWGGLELERLVYRIGLVDPLPPGSHLAFIGCHLLSGSGGAPLLCGLLLLSSAAIDMNDDPSLPRTSAEAVLALALTALFYLWHIMGVAILATIP